MKARRKDNGQWVDVYHYAYIDFGTTKIYKEFNSNTEYKENELVLEDTEIVNSYWFNFRNQAAMHAMQVILANDINTYRESPEQVAKKSIEYADALIRELNDKTD